MRRVVNPRSARWKNKLQLPNYCEKVESLSDEIGQLVPMGVKRNQSLDSGSYGQKKKERTACWLCS